DTVFANLLPVGRLERATATVAALEPPPLPPTATAVAANSQPVPPPLPVAILLSAVAEPFEPPVRRRGRGKRLIAASIAVFAIVAGVAYASTQFGRKPNNLG